MFLKAKPVWLTGRETEINLRVQFKTSCPAAANAVLRLATSGIYHVTVNGVFVAYGPARAGKRHFRVDELDITQQLTAPQNTVVIDVVGYNAYSFYVQNQPSFLQAEVIANDIPVAWTGEHFTARVHPFALQKTQRYSYQRPMMEAYRITGADTFLTDTVSGTEPITETAPKTLLPRNVPYPLYERESAAVVRSGTVQYRDPEQYLHDRSCANVNPTTLTGFPIPELTVFPSDECQRMHFTADTVDRNGVLSADTYTLYKFSHNATGMVTAHVSCDAPVTLYMLFDEVLIDGTFNFLRLDHGACANAMRFDLCAGEHDLGWFEVYTLQYLKIVAVGGGCTVTDVHLIEYKHPPVKNAVTAPTAALRRIADAAVETYRQNAVDLYSDCPSRERAGWLCDGFFTGRVEYLLTDDCVVETNFLENFLHENTYDGIPDDMFPMCYPADHLAGEFIPQWSLWLMLELEEYAVKRNGDRDLIARYRPRLERLLSYFARFENEDGLLCRLPGWNFVEWSKANDLINDVNYPTNMVYAAALKAMTALYGEKTYAEKAAAIEETVRRQSYDGTFFVDNAVYRDGVLVPTGECTEVCQYYAFFFGLATPETHPELWQKLLTDFGPDRDKTGKWPEIYPANAFIGNYLRLDILMRYGIRDQVLQNIEEYFTYMVDMSGTLWERVDNAASCCHGFASHILCWLDACCS